MSVPAIFKNVTELFSSTKPAAPAPALPAGENAALNPGVQTNAEPLKSPLDEVAEVFKLADTNNAANKNPLEAPLFDMDATKFAERVSTMNFAEAPVELMEKAKSGDTAALMELMNQVGRNAYSQAVQLNTRLTEAGINNRMAGLQTVLPNQIRTQQVSELLSNGEQSKALLHPSIAPVVADIQAKFEAAYPGAPATEIASMVTGYFGNVAKSLTPAAAQTQVQVQANAAQDFSDYFSR